MKNTLKIIFVIPFLSAAFCFADELKNFDEIKASLDSGNKISIVTSIQNCTTDGTEKVNLPEITGVYFPNELMVTSKKISTSNLHFTRNNPKFKDKSIFEFITYNFDIENNLKLTTEILDYQYQPIGKSKIYTCIIGKSVKVYSH